MIRYELESHIAIFSWILIRMWTQLGSWILSAIFKSYWISWNLRAFTEILEFLWNLGNISNEIDNLWWILKSQSYIIDYHEILLGIWNLYQRFRFLHHKWQNFEGENFWFTHNVGKIVWFLPRTSYSLLPVEAFKKCHLGLTVYMENFSGSLEMIL